MSGGKKLAIAFLWLVILGGGAAVFRYVLYPLGTGTAPDEVVTEFDGAWEKAKADFSDSPKVDDYVNQVSLRWQADVRERLEKIDQDKRLKFPRIEFAIDAFSGYCVFRSDKFRQKLDDKAKQAGEERILLHLADDKADYKKRINALKKGEVKLGVFTIDALLNNSALFNELPASIVLVIDESRGADAVIGYQDAFPLANNIDTLNRPDVRFVLTPDSPSETLARVIKARLNNAQRTNDFLVRASGPEDVLKQFDKAKKTEARAFVLWEPFVSKALKEHPDAHVIADSSRFDGYIVDVLVVERKFLEQNRAVVQKVVAAYLETLAEYQNNKGMVDLVKQDAEKTGDKLDQQEAEKLVSGIWWKNARENYAHFGIEGQGLQPLSEMVSNILGVLRASNAIGKDPTGGQPERLFDAGVLRQLSTAGVRPDDAVPIDTAALAEAEWKSLQPVYTVPMDPIEFARGSDEVPDSCAVPDKVAEIMKTWPKYYLQVSGYALRMGDPMANRELADRRAQQVAAKVRDRGVKGDRIHAQGMAPGDSLIMGAEGDDRPRVTFQLLQKP